MLRIAGVELVACLIDLSRQGAAKKCDLYLAIFDEMLS